MNTERTLTSEPTFEERMAPYAEVIGRLKEKLVRGEKPITLDVKHNDEYQEWIAAVAFYEEYELLEYFLDFRDKLSAAHPDEKEEYDILNARVRPEFLWWQPTPLYFITSRNARARMKDPCKMLRFLAERGADVNRAAGDGTTPLWNQNFSDAPLNIMRTLLELGADPNQISVYDGCEHVPLAHCLLPNPDENGNSLLPLDDTAIQKAKMLLQHGADPNLASSIDLNYPPLMLAVVFGIAQDEVKASDHLLELIELLLQSGANPNFTDSEGNTPLGRAVEYQYLEVGQLLLLYGAEMPKEDENEAPRTIRTIAEVIEMADQYGDAMIPRTATDEDLEQCNTDLRECGLPELPADYAAFLKTQCMGFAFNSVELYGPDMIIDKETGFRLIDVVTATDDFDDHYGGDDAPLLCFGRRDGDYFTYDEDAGKYQVRDHECISDTWGEYDTFEEFFMGEVATWIPAPNKNDDNNEAEKEAPKSKSDRYIQHINEFVLPHIDYERLQKSYETDMAYAKGVLNSLHEAMITVYGSELIDEEQGDDDGFITIPGVLRNFVNGNICLALFALDVSGGELWETNFLCARGVVAQDEDDEVNRMYIPYHYGYTAVIPADDHIKKENLPDELKDVLEDFRNHYAELKHEVKGEQFEAPALVFHCEKCGTTNYFYEDNEPPYRCDHCQSELSKE